MASTHLARTNKLLLILADSTILSFRFSVLRLSSDPAKSIAEAVLIRTSSSVDTVSFIPRMACDLEETEFSYISGQFSCNTCFAIGVLTLVALVERLMFA